MDQMVAENGVQHVELLSSVNDDHGGVIVEMKEPMDSEAFHSLLRVSISQWKQQVFLLPIFLYEWIDAYLVK